MVTRSILIIDDDEDDLEIFKKALVTLGSGASCSVLSDPKRVLERLLSNEIRPDLIFLDLNMPTMNGQEFLKAVKEKEVLKEIPVVILATDAHSDMIAECKRLGALDFYIKPSSFSELKEIIESVLQRTSSMTR